MSFSTPVTIAVVTCIVLIGLYNTGSKNVDEQDTIRIRIFKASWCHHCRTFAPEIEKLIKISERINSRISVQVYDADNDAREVERAGIRGFPTILINGRAYDGKRNCEDILQQALE